MSTLKNQLLSLLFKKYNLSLVNYVHKLVRCRFAAEEIAQEAYVRLAETPACEQIKFPRAYLFRIALSLTVDKGRRNSTEQRYIDFDATVEDTHLTTPSPASLLESRQRWDVMAQALNELPLICRTVFVMNKLHAMSHSEIAAQLGISKSMVEKHMMRAMKHCKKRLGSSES